MLSKLKKGLSARHIIMIALGSSIGTGFFYGAGESIQLAGPSILLAYLLGGFMMYIIIRALGEMSVAEPNSGSFSFFANKYIGHYAGFISGWNYWFNYIIVCMLELTACGLFMDYWFPHATHWLISLVIMLTFMGINLLNVRIFGEIEFWFAGIKVLAVLLLIGFGLYILAFAPHFGPHESHVANLWQNGGVFAKGASGFLFSLVIVVFSFGGTELVGITAGETENPKKNIPLAINGIIVRIILFYIATLTIVICLYPWDKLDAHISPFVDVFKLMGIPKAASLMNLVAISAALSSLNSGIYGTGRMLHTLALQGNAPRKLATVSRNGAPRYAIFVSMLFIALTVVLNYIYPKYTFNLLLAIATISAMINWLTILIAHAYFKRKSIHPSPYPIFAYPLSVIFAIAFLFTVSISMYFMPSFSIAILIAPIWLALLSIGYAVKIKVHPYTRNA